MEKDYKTPHIPVDCKGFLQLLEEVPNDPKNPLFIEWKEFLEKEIEKRRNLNINKEV